MIYANQSKRYDRGVLFIARYRDTPNCMSLRFYNRWRVYSRSWHVENDMLAPHRDVRDSRLRPIFHKKDSNHQGSRMTPTVVHPSMANIPPGISPRVCVE